MKIKEQVFEPASFLKKEVLRIDFSDVTKREIPELYTALVKILRNRRGKTLSISINGPDFWFKNEAELDTFINGFFHCDASNGPRCFGRLWRGKVV